MKLFFYLLALTAFALRLMPPIQFVGISNKAKSKAAINTLGTIAIECAAKISTTGTATFIVPDLEGYKSNKKNIAGFYVGNIRKKPKTTIDCSTTEEIKLVSQDESKNPSFSYNPETREKSCSHNGPNEELYDCSARKNGRW